MDFMLSLPKTLSKLDYIPVIVDCLTKATHFISVRVDYSSKQLAKIQIKEIVRLHGETLTIIFKRGMNYTSKF